MCPNRADRGFSFMCVCVVDVLSWGLSAWWVYSFCGFGCLLVKGLTVSTSLIMMFLDPVKSGF